MFQHLVAVFQLLGLRAQVFLCLGHFCLSVLEILVAFTGQLRFDIRHTALQAKYFSPTDVARGFELPVDAQLVFAEREYVFQRGDVVLERGLALVVQIGLVAYVVCVHQQAAVKVQRLAVDLGVQALQRDSQCRHFGVAV